MLIFPRKHMFQEILAGIGRISLRHARIVLLLTILITIIAAYLASHLKFQSRFEDFLPQDSPVARAFQKAIERYGTSDHLIIVIEGIGEEDVERREELADAIRKKLQEIDEVQFIDYKIDEELQDYLQGGFLKYALLYLDVEGLEKLKGKLSNESIEQQVEDNRRILLSPTSIAAKEAINYDFLNFRSLYSSKIDLTRGKLRITFHDGYYFSNDLTMLIIFVKPIKPAQDVSFCKLLLEKVEKAVYEAGFEVDSDEQGDRFPNISVGFTGGYPISLAYDQLLRKDITLSIIMVFIGVVCLFVFIFRRAVSPLYAGFPLIVGVVCTMAFAYLTIGSINIFTGASAAMLMGLAIDFSIHLYNRYLEEIHLRRSIFRAFDNTMRETGIGIFTAMATTTVAFYAALFSDFKGLIQLGLICGSGMIICFFATMFILPALISFGIRSRKVVRGRKRGMGSFGMENISRWIIRNHKGIIILCVGMTVFLFLMIYQVHIEEDFYNLRPKGVPAIELQDRIVEKVGSPMIYTMIVGEAEDEQGILKLSDKISSRLEKLVEKGVVISYRSLSMILPPAEDQMRNINWLKEQKRKDPSAFNINRIRETLIDSLIKNGFKVEKSFERIIDFLKSSLSIGEPLTLKNLQNSSIRNIVERFVSINGDGYSQVTYVYPETNPSRENGFHVLVNEMKDIDESVQVVGAKILGMELKKLIKRSVLISTVIAFFSVTFILFLHFKKPYYVLLTVTPLIAGVIWGIGGMALFGFHFNMVSISIIPVIIGIGIDNGVHIVNRFIFEKENLRQIFQHTGRALIITSLTTMIGFGCLVFADYPALVGVGIVAIFGIGSTLLTSIFFLPALLTWVYHLQQR